MSILLFSFSILLFEVSVHFGVASMRTSKLRDQSQRQAYQFFLYVFRVLLPSDIMGSQASGIIELLGIQVLVSFSFIWFLLIS